MTILEGKFDVQIDSNHRWDEDRVLELCAYILIEREDGTTETDTLNPVASIHIPAFDVHSDIWIASTETDEIAELPPLVREAYSALVALATSVQKEQN